MSECPHGDATCPCQDGDPCHYEASEDAPTESGKLPMRCPRTGIVGCRECTLRNRLKREHENTDHDRATRQLMAEAHDAIVVLERLVDMACAGEAHELQGSACPCGRNHL